MIVTPGPALVVIPIGLAILGIEFAWARRWLKGLREKISNGLANNRAKRANSHRDRVESK
jgi:tellurite resistance protein TerC